MRVRQFVVLMYLICVYMCANTLLSEISPTIIRDQPLLSEFSPKRQKCFEPKNSGKKRKMLCTSLVWTKPNVYNREYIPKIQKNKFRHLCTPKTVKFTLIRLTISEIIPLFYLFLSNYWTNTAPFVIGQVPRIVYIPYNKVVMLQLSKLFFKFLR